MGKVYYKTCKVEPRKTANMIEAALLGENGTEGFAYERTVKFRNGVEVDINCYGKNTVNGKEVEPWVDVTMYDHGVKICQEIKKHFFGNHYMIDNNGNCYDIAITRDFSLFMFGDFYEKDGYRYFAVSKETAPDYTEAKKLTARMLYRNIDDLVYNDEYKFMRWRARHNHNGKSCVDWFLEREDSPTSCPVWVFTVEQYR